MNIEQLKENLIRANVPTYYYNLDGIGREDERLCLKKENLKWVVYYSERGVRTTEEFFDNEESACKYLYDKLLK